MNTIPLIAVRSFIQATRDSGYKTTSSAIAELLDNSFEARATSVTIVVEDAAEGEWKRITVTDDGEGMSEQTLQFALQFGGSTRFNSRTGTGRYGMGLPNGSLSQARRVDVYSWRNPLHVWSSSLDVDEIAAGLVDGLGEPVRFRPDVKDLPRSPSGTVVVLSRCDRLDFRRTAWLLRRMKQDFAVWFRDALFAGKEIYINGEAVQAWDPLYRRGIAEGCSAAPYGPPLHYEVLLPDGGTTEVRVEFSLLPIRDWHSLSNAEKGLRGITKGAGVSIVRAGRQIDYGWFFMGAKRKENYDDWWRCEVRFDPDADELFGVTHTKQRISPGEFLNSILNNDLERIGRELNGIVRKIYLKVKEEEEPIKSVARAEGEDPLLPPAGRHHQTVTGKTPLSLNRLRYQLDFENIESALDFYVPEIKKNCLRLTLNRDHEFFRNFYAPLAAGNIATATILERLQLILFAAARTESRLRTQADRRCVAAFRREWSNALTAFLR